MSKSDITNSPRIAQPAQPVRILPAVVGLGLTQIIGWGTTFSAIAVLGSRFGADLAMSREAVFAGISVMLVVSAVLSPRFGRMLDQNGPRMHMAAGSLAAALALLLMSLSQGPILYWLAWAVFGVAVPLSLTNAAVPAIVQIAGSHARRAVTGLTIIGGVTSAMFLPITAWLDAQLGWRLTLLVFAGMHLVVALPIHLLILPHGRPERRSETPSSDAPWEGVVPERLRERAFWLLVVWSCLEGMLVWGFNLQAVDLLRGFGLSLNAAIGVWVFSGPSQAIARVGELILAGRYPIIVTGLVSVALAPIGFAIFLISGASVTAATLMAICYGLGHGLFVIARNMLPLRLFGLKTFGATMGRLALPQNLANAIAPIIFATLISRIGSTSAVWFAVACALFSLAAVIALARTLKAAERDTPE